MKTNDNNYNLEDFVANDEFVNWVLHPTEESNLYWSQWISKHPDKKQTIQSAKAFIKNIYVAEEQFISKNTTDETWEKIKNQTIDRNSDKRIHRSFRLNWVKYAAAILLLGFISIYFFQKNSFEKKLVETEKSRWILEENISGVPKLIHLVDGSKVILEPYGSLKYPTVFNGKQRDVFLQGEAFFDVARDTIQPFLIYANETITKVLGTSFTIKAFEGDEDVEVIVKTGKVAVYAKVASTNDKTARKRMIVKADEAISVPVPNRKLEITPNQKVVFNKKKKELVKTIAPIPVLINQSVQQMEKLEFEESSVLEVFKALEKAYGLQIIFDAEQLNNCTITTVLTDMPMMNKIDIICQALSLKFEERNGRIYITGNGC